MEKKNYDIIATLGPVSDEPNLWHSMLDEGVTGFRLNTSHLTLPELKDWLKRYRFFSNGLNTPCDLILDLQGSKWRLGNIIESELVQGESVKLVHSDTSGQRHVLPVPHADFFAAAPKSAPDIFLNDAKVHLMVQSINEQTIVAKVVRGGQLSSGKGLTFAESQFRQEAFSPKDLSIIQSTSDMPNIRYAVSYVKDADEMAYYKTQFKPGAYIIAKIERKTAVNDLSGLSEQASELWVCRGDLGAELGLSDMAQSVNRISEEVARLPIPVLMAGQVLEHMTALPVSTRSEICYMYDCLHTGYKGFVLSDETAIGKFPIVSCKTAAIFKM